MIKEIKKLKNTSVKDIVNKRLKEFDKLGNEGNKDWFSELCFCILTANSKAETAINIQREIGKDGFLNFNKRKISSIIKNNKHRFHNNKAQYIIEARKFKDIKNKIKEIERENKDIREFLVKNIKGIGYKEASHFLRNVGYKNFAILDRHIINYMLEREIIREKPKTLTRKIYLELESKFKKIAKGLKMNCVELDLYMWFLKTGRVLK